MKRVLNKISTWFKSKFSNNEGNKKLPVVTQPIEPSEEEKKELEKNVGELIQVLDFENNGNPKKPDWTYLITTCKIDEHHKEEVYKIARQQIANFSKYLSVSEKTGVPIGVIADIHQKECSLSFSKVLHNGQPIVGTGKKTTWVPAGRGPFRTWDEAAIDALLLKKAIFPTSTNWAKYYPEQGWTTQNILRFHQFYNGLGHQNKGLEYTPYVWAYTNHHDETGNYVSDGKYDKNAVIKNGGVMAYMIARHDLLTKNSLVA